jgi:uncharacterized protein YecT (DUF1311 family)
MLRRSLVVLAATLPAACAEPLTTEQHAQTCQAFGHQPGTEAMAACIQSEMSKAQARADAARQAALRDLQARQQQRQTYGVVPRVHRLSPPNP